MASVMRLGMSAMRMGGSERSSKSHSHSGSENYGSSLGEDLSRTSSRLTTSNSSYGLANSPLPASILLKYVPCRPELSLHPADD